MEEFLFDGKSAKAILNSLQAVMPSIASASDSSLGLSEVAEVLGFSAAQSTALQLRVDKHLRLKSLRVTDWVTFYIDVNGIVTAADRGALRNQSAMLAGPELWMEWIAPPEDIRFRTHDVFSAVFGSPPTAEKVFAIFPLIILLHPCKDGNSRSALIVLFAYNKVYRLIDDSLVLKMCTRLRLNRSRIVNVLSLMRTCGDVLSYAEFVKEIIATQKSDSRGAT